MALSFTIRKAGQTIQSMDDWFQWAPPPEGGAGWNAGDPEREFAGLFFDATGKVRVPPSLQDLLAQQASLGAVTLQSMIPGYLIALNSMTGGSVRYHGVAIGTSREGRVAVTQHARSEEGFGPLIADQAKRSKPGSHWMRRTSHLAEALFDRTIEDCGPLRGELLRLAAGALRVAETEKSGTAVLVFHEFRPKEARAAQVRRNASDLDALAVALGGKPLKAGQLAGPFRVPGGHEIPASVPLYLGKITTLL